MKLDVNALRYLSREDFRVLTAVEMGQKNVRALRWLGWSILAMHVGHVAVHRSVGPALLLGRNTT